MVFHKEYKFDLKNLFKCQRTRYKFDCLNQLITALLPPILSIIRKQSKKNSVKSQDFRVSKRTPP